MRKKLLALVGATGLFLGAALVLPAAANAAPVVAPSASSQAAANSNFIAMLQPVAAPKADASGEAWVALTGNSAKFTLQVSGLVAGAPHLSHLYIGSAGNCAAAVSGKVAASLTTSGDTSAGSALALARYPTAADYTYSRTFTVDPWVSAAVKDGTAVLVVRGVDDDGKPTGAPALCGAFVASQMVVMPNGPADTGGGSAAGASYPMLIALGAMALLAALFSASVALRRRPGGQSVEVVATNGFRRLIR